MPVPKACRGVWTKEKHKRCIKKVENNSPDVNPYAVCNKVCKKIKKRR